jgi:fatty-acyl-CoA synthase
MAESEPTPRPARAPAAPPSRSIGGSEVPLLEETTGENLRRSVREYGDREALVECATGRRWTYAAFGAEVDALALGLLELGVRPGDRVGIWAPNCAEWMIFQYAAATISAILVNISPAYRAGELEYVLNHAGVRLLAAPARYKTSDYRKMIDEVRPRCPSLEHVLMIGGDDWAAVSTRTGHNGVPLPAKPDPGDPINIQYTSGTTGLPKGATLSHRNILNNGYFVGERCGYTENDRICVPVPFYHCFGMVMGNLAATTHGACVVIPAPSFDRRATLAAVETERCSSLYGVPAMFIAELADPEFGSFDLSSLRTGIMSGSPCPVEVMRQVIEKMGMAEVTICYGMTETSPVATQTHPCDPLERRVSTVGRAGPHVEIKVVDPATGRTVPRGVPGEVCTRGYSVMLGYWAQPDRTAAAIDAGGWMHTGDLAVMDGDGYLMITGRIKDMVIRGGENIYPREVEEFLYGHPDILDVQVVGVPDDRYGEELMAWIRPRPGVEPPTAESVREFCRGRLAHYKIPRYVRTVDAFPMTASGKVRKVELRERAAELLRSRGLGETPQS